jgi:hypothetical protein
MGEIRNVYKILVGKPEGKRPLGRHKSRWSIILKWILEKLGGNVWTGFNWHRIASGGGFL